MNVLQETGKQEVSRMKYFVLKEIKVSEQTSLSSLISEKSFLKNETDNKLEQLLNKINRQHLDWSTVSKTKSLYRVHDSLYR